jgi:hypothetical protein
LEQETLKRKILSRHHEPDPAETRAANVQQAIPRKAQFCA